MRLFSMLLSADLSDLVSYLTSTSHRADKKVVGMLRNSGGSPAATNNPCDATRILINRIFMIP
jgi:hypothetical protein